MSLCEMIEDYVAAYNRQDIDSMLELVTEDVVFENISNSGGSMTLQGKKAMSEVAQLGTEAFTYRRQRILKMICSEDEGSAEVQFTGLAALDLPNGVKKGETVELRGVTIFETQDGKFCRIADYS